jgi:hypothetical protein
MLGNWLAAGPIATLFASVAVAFVLIGIGRVADRIFVRGAPDLAAPISWLITGWAIASLTAALSALSSTMLYWPAACLAVVGIAGYFVALPRTPLIWLGLSWLLVAPLLFIASTIPPTMFDEFAHWLPNTRFLVEYGRFSDAGTPNIWSGKAAYPPAIPIIGFSVALIGQGAEMAAKVFSVLLAASFGLVLAELIRNRFGIIFSLAIGVAFATVTNPFFDPRISLTAYGDTPTGFVLAFLVYSSWRAVGEQGAQRIWEVVGACVLIVLLRETNIVLAAGTAIGLALTGRRGRLLCASMTIASIAPFLLWRSYIAAAAMPATLLPRPLADWKWNAPWLVVKTLFTERFANHLLLGGGVLLLLTLAIAALIFRWRLFHPLRQLFLISGTVACLWILFLLWTYIAVLPLEEIQIAGSTWRYLSQLGPTLIVVCFEMWSAAISDAAKSVQPIRFAASVTSTLGILTCMLPGLVIVATRSHWQIDLQYPMTRTIHSVAPVLAPIIGAERFTVIHPVDASALAVEFDYDLHRPVGRSVPAPTLDEASPDGFALDVTGLEVARCPQLLQRVDTGWREVTPPHFFSNCKPVPLHE